MGLLRKSVSFYQHCDLLNNTRGTEMMQTTRSPKLKSILKKPKPDVSKWTPWDITFFFVQKNFNPKDAVKFVEHDIDGECLLIMERQDLKDLEISSLGDMIKMWDHISSFQKKSHE